MSVCDGEENRPIIVLIVHRPIQAIHFLNVSFDFALHHLIECMVGSSNL